MDEKQLCPDCVDEQAVVRLRYLAHGLQVLSDRLKHSSHGEAAIAWGLALTAWEVAGLLEGESA